MEKRRLFKRLGSLFLAVIMIMGMSVPVLAKDIDTDESVSLTINKYKVLDTTAWEDLEDGTGLTTDNFPTGATPLAGVTYTITLMSLKDGETDTSVLGNYEKSTDPAVTLTGVTDEDGQIVFDDGAYQAAGNSGQLPQGVYKVKETINDVMVAQSDTFYVSLPMTDPTDNDAWLYNVNVYPKNKITDETVTLEKKVLDNGTWADEKNVETGETVTWQIKSTIPTNIKNARSYEIKDEYDSRLSLISNTISVYYNDRDADSVLLGQVDDFEDSGLEDETGDYWITYDNNKFTVHLTQKGMTELDAALTADAEKNLYIQFNTTVTIGSATDICEIVNNADLTYVNQFDQTSKVDDSALVWSGGMLITKKDGTTNNALNDVEFKLYCEKDSVKYYYGGPDSINGGIIWTTDETKAKKLITKEEGKFEVLGLQDGTYWLTEIKTLDGYNLLAEDVSVEIARTESLVQGSNGEAIYDYVEKELTIKNFKGFVLPLTGGSGTLWITVIGLALIAAGGIIVIMSKRKKAGKNVNA